MRRREEKAERPAPTAAAEPRAREQADWLTFVVIGGALALTQLAFQLTAAPLSLYLHDVGAPQDRIGLDIGLGNVTALLATLALGPAINRIGARPFLGTGAALYIVAACGMLLLPHEGAIGGFRALQGLGNAAIVPSAYTLGARLIPGRPATALGVLGALTNLSLATGPPVGLSLYTQHGASWLFLASALAAGLGLLSVLLVPSIEAAAEPDPGFGFDRVWIAPLLANTLAVMYFGGVLAYLPLYLHRLHGPNAGVFFTADALGVLLLRVPTGMLVDRHSSLLPKLLGLGITLPGIAVLALPPSIFSLGCSGALTGMGAGLFITGVMADLANLSSGGNRGTAMSLGSASFSGGVFVGSTTSGLLIGPGGFGAILLLGEVTSLAALPFALTRGNRPGQQTVG